MNQTPFVLLADVHLHSWSQFSAVDECGQNTRLTALLSEITRAADTILAAGGKHMVIAGDLFHVRGNLAPSVLNPTLDTFRAIIERGITVSVIPGNHDLEGRNSNRLGSAVTALEGIGARILNEPCHLSEERAVVVPWVDDVGKLKERLTELAAASSVKADCDLIIHAPVNGVIMGIPDHGLEPAWLAALGFKRVFAGHYHNHVVFEGSVHSVGALAHHTFNDVGSKAGFLVVQPDRVEHHSSQLPQFVDIYPETPASEIAKQAKGNFLRVKTSTSKLADLQKLREWLEGQGAKGVTIISVKAPTEERPGGSPVVSAGATVEQSVAAFIKIKVEIGQDAEVFPAELADEITKGALRVLADVQTAA